MVPDGAEQAALYLRLGEVYDKHQPNPERAELAYREVLRRLPGDETAHERLLDIYSRTGDAAQATETAQALIAAAPTPEVKRKRIAELARVHEQVARDPKKAEALLEAARKEAPGDIELLAGLAGSTSAQARCRRSPCSSTAQRATLAAACRPDVSKWACSPRWPRWLACASGTRRRSSPKRRWPPSKAGRPS